MPRSLVAMLALSLCLAVLDPAFSDEAPASVAPDDEAHEALETFKTEYKAKGLKGDEKLMQRDWAMRELSKVQHPDVVDELGKISKKRGDLATLAVIYLGEQKALPGSAGKLITKSISKNQKDPVLVMSGLESLAELGYLGARDELQDLMGSRDFAMKKYAIQTIGRIGDVRMMGDLLKLLGIDLKNEKQQSSKDDDPTKKGGEKEVVEEGYSWDGVDVTYDTGTAGDGDQKMAEKIGKEKLAQNKAKAMAGKSGGGGGGLGGVSGTGPRGGSSRSMEELVPTVLKALYAMTGEKFDKGADIRKWLAENGDKVEARKKLLDEMEKAQADDR